MMEKKERRKDKAASFKWEWEWGPCSNFNTYKRINQTSAKLMYNDSHVINAA